MQQELEEDDYVELESDVEQEPTIVQPDVVHPDVIQLDVNQSEPDIDLTSDWDPKKTTVADPRIPIIKLSTDYGRKLKAANKIKEKYLKKTIGQRNKSNNICKMAKNCRLFWYKRPRQNKLYFCPA